LISGLPDCVPFAEGKYPDMEVDAWAARRAPLRPEQTVKVTFTRDEPGGYA
jgi:hypothetical protein